MSGRSYPIWNQVQSCIYESSKSYGVKVQGDVTVKIGSSKGNSHGFVTHSVKKRSFHHDSYGDVISFEFYVCDCLVKESLFSVNRHGNADDLISEKCAWIGTVSHKRIRQHSAE